MCSNELLLGMGRNEAGHGLVALVCGRGLVRKNSCGGLQLGKEELGSWLAADLQGAAPLAGLPEELVSLRARTTAAAGGRTRPGPRGEEARGAGAARGRAFALPSKEVAGSRGSFGAGSGWWDWIRGNEEIPRKKGRWVAAARE